MKIRTIIDDGGATLPAPVDTYTLTGESHAQHCTRHCGEVETATASLSTVDALVTTIVFPDDDVIQVSTWLGEFDPNETPEEHVARHSERVAEVIEAWP